MKPILIITRPEPDGARFAAAVREAVAVDVILSPLMKIEPLYVECQADAVIFTSTNGVAQAERLGLKRGRAWCVGDRTAEMAREAGFDAVSAQGTVEELLALVLADAPKGMIAHIRGKEARGDLGSRLRAQGINCTDVIAYAQVAVPLNDAARAAIAGADPVVIPLFSPRSADLLVKQVKIGPQAKVLAMSDAVARMLPDVEVDVIARPDADAMHAAVVAALTACLRVR